MRYGFKFYTMKKRKESINKFIVDFLYTINIRDIKDGGIGLREKSKKNYTAFQKAWMAYENHVNMEIYFNDLDKRQVDHFKYWLLEVKKYSTNTAGRHFGTLKTLVSEAKKCDIKVHKYAKYIKGFYKPKIQLTINTLNSDEILRICKLSLNNPSLENARKWMIIGVFIGQRISDLLNITEKNIRKSKILGYYIDLTQQKTGHKITIGVANPYVIKIIETGLPNKIHDRLFNKQMRQILELAGITQMVQGYKFCNKTKRRVLGVYKKCDIMASHDLRRSFATNYYGKIETPIIMRMTGHSRENNFLRYIGASENLDYIADTFISKLASLDAHDS